jgi:alpha-galactosidase
MKYFRLSLAELPMNSRRSALAIALIVLAVAAKGASEPSTLPDGMPAVEVRHSDGSRSIDWRPVEQSATFITDGRGLLQYRTFKDVSHPLTLRVHRRTYRDLPIAEEWTEIDNGESGPVVLERIESSAPTFKGEMWLRRFQGKWADELNPVEGKLEKPASTGSTRGARVSEQVPPFFLLSTGGPAREDSGDVVAGSLAWNGNFLFDFAPQADGATVRCGINPAGSHYVLDAGKTFTAPHMVWIWSQTGTGDLSRTMHRYVRSHVLRDGDRPRPVLLNNWEATGFKFDEKKLVSLFDGARDAHFDLFLLDDGWFAAGENARNSDHAGLGDWTANPAKLPHGISFLCDEAKKCGLRFGIWIEPEMVNPKSELFAKHPEWALQDPGKPLNLVRNQLVLDLTRPEVREYAFKSVDDLLTANPGVSYIKWDCNRHITQRHSSWLPEDRQDNLFVDYANALDDIMGRLAKKHPNVEMMLCAGGGGRVDLRSLSHFHEFWPSDNTDPARRAVMQWDYSLLYPAISMCDHVTHWGKRPLKFAFDVAMSGRLGADIDLGKLSDADREFAADAVETYKRDILPVVQFGDLYRLESPHDGPRAALDYVSADKSAAVLFVYPLKAAEASPVRPRGLDPKARYRVREINRRAESTSSLSQDGAIVSGETLMTEGLVPESAQFASTVVKFERVR